MHIYKKHLILRELKRSLEYYKTLNDEEKLDHEVLKYCLEKTATIGENFPDSIKNNKEFFLKYLKINPLIFKYANVVLKNDPQIIEVMCNTYAEWRNYAKKTQAVEIENYENIILEIFPSLKTNKKTIYQVVLSLSKYYNLNAPHPTLKKVLDYMKPELKKDVSFLCLLVSKNPNVYQYLHPTMQDEGDIMIAAMKGSNGTIFKSFNSDFRNDAFFVQYMNTIYKVDKKDIGEDLREKIGKDNLEQYCKVILLKESIEGKIENLPINQAVNKKKTKL